MGDKRESVSSTLSSDFILNYSNKQLYPLFLNTVSEGRLFSLKKESSIQDVVSRINTALNTRNSRLEGLYLLEQTVEQCSTETFTQNSLSWSRTLLQNLQGHQSPAVILMTCRLFTRILQHAADFPELSRDFANNVIPNLITSLIGLCKDELILPSLECINSCLLSFNGPCAPSRGKVEQLVVPLMNNLDDAVSKGASVTYSLLPRCGGGGNQGIKHTEAWTYFSDKLINTLSTIISDLYRDVDNSSASTAKGSEPETLPWPKPEISQPAHNFQQMRRFNVVCFTLQKMLSNEFPAVIKFPLAEIIKLIFRTVAVTPTQLLKKETRDSVHLASVLPSIHKSAFSLLSSITEACGSNILPFADSVHRMFSIALEWSAMCDAHFGTTRPYQGLRSKVYYAMTTWMQVLGAAASVEKMSSILMEHGVKDAKPQTDSIKKNSKLETVEHVYTHTNKKRKKHGGGDLGEFSSSRKIDRLANKQLCSSSLKALRWMVQTCGGLLSPTNHKVLQSFVIPVLLEVGQGPADYPIPYEDSTCRQELYRLLLHLVLSPNPRWPAPIQCAVQIFREGRGDPDLEVANFCKEGSTICQCLVHPRTPSYTFPIPATEIRDTLNKNEKQTDTKGALNLDNLGYKPKLQWNSNNSGVRPNFLLGKSRTAVLESEGNDSVNHSPSSGGESSEEEPNQSRITAFQTNNRSPGPRLSPGDAGDERGAAPGDEGSPCGVEDPGDAPTPGAVTGVREGLASMEIEETRPGEGARKRRISECEEEEEEGDAEPVPGTSGTNTTGNKTDAVSSKVTDTKGGSDESDDMPSVEEMMATLVNAPPDSDQE